MNGGVRNIYEKLAAVQQEVKAPKNQKNTHLKFNYRSAEGILEAVKPILQKYGATIFLSDEIVEKNGRTYVMATAVFLDPDKDGKAIQVTAYAREADSKTGLDVAQVTGSASSYARKYALNGLLLLDDAKQDPDTEENTRRVEQAEEQARAEMNAQPPTLKLYASEEQIATIRELAEKAGVDLSAIGEDVETMSAKRADAMIARLKEKVAEK